MKKIMIITLSLFLLSACSSFNKQIVLGKRAPASLEKDFQLGLPFVLHDKNHQKIDSEFSVQCESVGGSAKYSGCVCPSGNQFINPFVSKC